MKSPQSSSSSTTTTTSSSSSSCAPPHYHSPPSSSLRWMRLLLLVLFLSAHVGAVNQQEENEHGSVVDRGSIGISPRIGPKGRRGGGGGVRSSQCRICRLTWRSASLWRRLLLQAAGAFTSGLKLAWRFVSRKHRALFRFYRRMFQRLASKKAAQGRSQRTWWVRLEEREVNAEASGTTTEEERRQQQERFIKEYKEKAG
eukprot:752753-Hanusia_phi.AAC.3